MKAVVNSGTDNINIIDNELRGSKLGLITGPSGVTKTLQPTAERLNTVYRLTALYSPEHGLRGSEQAGGYDSDHRDPDTGIPVFSLAGDNSYPTEEMLSRIEIMLFDIQDVGARYYTYLYTMTRAMKSCAKYKKPFIVLDRMNPIALNRFEGNILNEQFASFVGEYAVPCRYAMTIGEFARYINGEYKLGCELTVVPCEGLTRELYYDDTDLPFVSPSPNIPTVETAIHYIGTCLFEGTNLSEGRGTTHPFELIGAPWLKSSKLCERMKSYGFDGVIFRRAFFTPTFSKYQGQCCEGLQLHITDRDRYQPFEVALRLIDEIRAEYSEFQTTPFIDHIFGDDLLRKKYIGRSSIDDFLTLNENRLSAFRENARKYYLY